MLPNSKTQSVTEKEMSQNSTCLKTQNFTKLKNLQYDKTKKIKM